MARTKQLHLHHSRSLNRHPGVRHPLQPSQGSSGVGSTSSCCPVLDTAWDWGTCGASRTSVTAMEEVSGLQELPLKASHALNAWAYVCNHLLHPCEQEALLAMPLCVHCPPDHAGLFCTFSPALSVKAFGAGS